MNMKNMGIVFLISLAIISLAKGQTIVKLNLPTNCNATNDIISKEVKNNLLVYPNPTEESCSLDISFAKNIDNATLSLYNSSGQLVYSETVYCNQNRMVKNLNLKPFAAGTYIIVMKNISEEIRTKLIKK